ncbi:hypothetical protein HN766_03140 [Candidatus Poribacteria bacterium]|nr:hypothetical protein [Candidatus Poribacteria bacterium]
MELGNALTIVALLIGAVSAVLALTAYLVNLERKRAEAEVSEMREELLGSRDRVQAQSAELREELLADRARLNTQSAGLREEMVAQRELAAANSEDVRAYLDGKIARIARNEFYVNQLGRHMSEYLVRLYVALSAHDARLSELLRLTQSLRPRTTGVDGGVQAADRVAAAERKMGEYRAAIETAMQHLMVFAYTPEMLSDGPTVPQHKLDVLHERRRSGFRQLSQLGDTETLDSLRQLHRYEDELSDALVEAIHELERKLDTA